MEDSVTQWIHGLAEGDESAAQRLWERFNERIVRLARRKLDGLRRREADEEDVAQAALASFYRGVKAGRFPRLDDREDLWRVLVDLTVKKAINQQRRLLANKRQPEVGESRLARVDASSQLAGMGLIQGDEPTPELVVMLRDQCGELLKSLDDDTQRDIVSLKLEGYNNREIAERLDIGLRSVDRKLGIIRDKMTRLMEA